MISDNIIRDSSLITLSSGTTSQIYYDVKSVMMNPYGLQLITTLMRPYLMDARSVGGMEIASIPISTIISDRYGPYQFIVRKNQKKHGLMKRIEGRLMDPIWVVDDVLTTGNSIMECIGEIGNEGYGVAGVVVVVDRENEKNILKECGIKYHSLFKHSDFNHVNHKNI